MERGFWNYFGWSVRAINAASFIKLLIVASAASGAAVTLGALWQQVPWYIAITSGSVLFAALVMAVVGIDYLRRMHGIRGKIGVRRVQVRSISFNPTTNKVELRISVYILNDSTRPLWISIERAQCLVDLQSHAPNADLPDVEEVQPGMHRGYSPDGPISLDPSKTEFQGSVEVDAKYGKKKDKLWEPYKTKGNITVNIANTPLGWTATITTLGGVASFK
jgi:hypothetical protein